MTIDFILVSLDWDILLGITNIRICKFMSFFLNFMNCQMPQSILFNLLLPIGYKSGSLNISYMNFHLVCNFDL